VAIVAATVSSVAGHLTEADRRVPGARETQGRAARPTMSWQLS